MKCFYHGADLDGHCSGAIVRAAYPQCEMYPINYGDPFPWADLHHREKVFMVDFCLQPFQPDMLRLRKESNLIWIDHHKSAIESWLAASPDGLGLKINGMRSLENSQAGCELIWNFLSGDKPVPLVVKYLSLYDIWQHNDDPKILGLQHGLRQYDTDPKNQKLWQSLFSDPFYVAEIIKEGQSILKYVISENKKYAKVAAFKTELNGYKCIAINKMLTNSQLFDSVWDNSKYEVMIAFGFFKNEWGVSLYSDREDIDVSEIAKKYGGGGHKGAAGFQCKKLPFNL